MVKRGGGGGGGGGKGYFQNSGGSWLKGEFKNSGGVWTLDEAMSSRQRPFTGAAVAWSPKVPPMGGAFW